MEYGVLVESYRDGPARRPLYQFHGPDSDGLAETLYDYDAENPETIADWQYNQVKMHYDIVSSIVQNAPVCNHAAVRTRVFNGLAAEDWRHKSTEVREVKGWSPSEVFHTFEREAED